MGHQENGNEAAWQEAVFAQFEGPLVRYATRLVGDAERGRDVVQDVFLRLCGEAPERTQDHVAAWLYTVCRNRALDVRKKERRMNSLPHTAAAASIADPAMLVERQEQAGQLLGILAQLPENQQEVIRLKIEHGLSYRQISEVTGLSTSNVGYLLHHGLQAMRRQVARQENQ